MLSRTTPGPDPVLVVGAGPVGLVAACELLRRGVPVRLIDASRRQSAHSRATSLWPRVLELLNRIDVADELVETGHRIDRVAYYSAGRRLATVRFDRLARTTATPYPFGLTIPQSRTEEVLRRRLAALGGAIESGVRLVGLTQEGPLALAVLSHPDGRLEEVSAPWLIGADGAHSTTRSLLEVPSAGPELDVAFAITDAAIEGDLPTGDLAYCWTPRGGLALGPLGGDVFRIAVRVPDASGDREPSREFFQSMLDQRAPGRGGRIGELRFSTSFQVRVRTAARFRVGRCFLAGDAAHVMSPAGGQGMNTGLQDAVNLGWKLSGVLTGALDEPVLDSYDSERRTATRVLTAATSRQTRWGGYQTRGKILTRDLVLRAAGATGQLQRRVAPLVSQLDSAYPVAGAPAVRPGRRPAALRPGDRVPALPGGADRPAASSGLVGLARDGFTVLLWPGRDWLPSARAALDSWEKAVGLFRAALPEDVPVVLLRPDRNPEFREPLGALPAAALVRPDGHLQALTGTGPDQPEQLAALHRAALRGAPAPQDPTPKRSTPQYSTA